MVKEVQQKNFGSHAHLVNPYRAEHFQVTLAAHLVVHSYPGKMNAALAFIRRPAAARHTLSNSLPVRDRGNCPTLGSIDLGLTWTCQVT